jgi:hypothetical protein
MGPRRRSAALFAALIVGAYVPLTRAVEPVARRAWFDHVTRELVTDARGLMPPEGTMWLGATRPELPQSTYGLAELEALLGQQLAIASFYQAWGDGPAHAFPTHTLESLHEGGYLPMITWEPWLSAFTAYAGKVPSGSLRTIASGALDAYIEAWARDAVRYGKPFFLRIGHEPTNPWYGWAPQHGNSAEDYRAFWAHVHGIFRAQGARNVLFVWTPYALTDHAFFPGKERVDWIGLDVFNYGQLAENPVWLDFHTLTKLAYDAYGQLGAPLMIAEVATSAVGGSKADWLRGMFHSLERGNFPKLRAVVLFDHPSARTAGGIPVDWSVGQVQSAVAAWKRDPRWLAQFTRRAQKVQP